MPQRCATRSCAPARQLTEEVERHGISAFGDLKYPADFKHFDFVNPNAPKGGVFSQLGSVRQFNQNFLTFNSLNSYILRGDAALGMELTFASLMSPSMISPLRATNPMQCTVSRPARYGFRRTD